MSFVKSGMVVGLGTGTTADLFLVALSNAIKSGKLSGVQGIPTSKQSERRAQELGIPLTNLKDSPMADVTIDAVPTPTEIDHALAKLEGLAKERGVAVGTASALPVSIERLGAWIKTLESRGILLVPLTTAMLKSKSS